ncbi:MAG: hypothetical protein WB773_07280 [Isosphaeraceae bacterium]
MQVLLGLLMAALIGVDDTADSYAAPKAVVSRTGVLGTKSGPIIGFEIRDIRVSSPEWRGKLILRMQPVTRQEGTAVWSLDPAGFKELLEFCQADPRSNALQAPKMTARVGDPARMTSEETIQYVASLKRVADGPPNQSTKLAFEPQLDKVHNGVRVNILSSQLKGQNLFARVVIDENRLVAIHMVKYTEAVQPKPGADPEVSRASFLNRLNPNHGPHAAAINATFQVPEVDSRRVEGEWLIPSDGALLVSLGPRALHERGFQQKGYEEHLIAITARPLAEPAQAPVQRPATAGSPKPR